jgi:eukaryotic-like serine/threonine-protein kinase
LKIKVQKLKLENMADDSWQKVREIFHSALGRQSEERRRFVHDACGKDKTLLAEVESLLSSHDSAESFMETPAVAKVADMIEPETKKLGAGKVFGQYEIIEQVGAGGMGEVYLAKDARLNRQVAVKILPESIAADKDRVRRFEREAQAASALNHPNIITIFEIGETDNTHFIATEYIEGDTLRERFRGSPINLKSALEIAVQVVSALDAAHRTGIVHRDIKPENLMIRPDGLVKILDFGIAKLTEKLSATDLEAATAISAQTRTGVIIGTAAYMSPEQARGQTVDARSDIFSFGLVLYEMLAGQPPFAGESAIEIIGSILNKEPVPLSRQTPEVPHEIERIINKTLRKDREERYQTAKDLLIDLKDFKQDLEFQNKLERTAAPDLEEAKTQVVNATTSDFASHTTSSAEYLMSKFYSHKRGALLTLAILVIVAGSISFMWYRFMGPDPSKPALPAAKIVPFTSFQGSELHPTFSPDGNQIAFAWNGEKSDNYDLYIKRNDAGSPPLRLTTNPADDLYPAWSPDGHHIAFVRQSGSEIGIFLVPALGGPERKLYAGTSAFFTLFEQGNALSWSPDGESLGFSGRDSPTEPNSIFVLSVGSLEKRKITSPSAGFLGDATPAFSPNGKTLAFMRWVSVGQGHIYLLSMSGSGGEPKPLTVDNSAQTNMATRSLAWTADSREIVFQSTSGRLWRVSASGGTPELLAGGGENTVSLAISYQGDRLAYSQAVVDTNIWQVELLGPTGKPGNPTNLISSTRQESGPQFSPDGKRIAFASGRTGSNNIWLSDSEGLNSIQLSSFAGPADVGSPRWSPDGRQIAFDSSASGNRDIYVLGAEGGKPRLLTEESAEDVRPSWSRDGEWIYFGSNRTGDWQVWKAPAKGGQAVEVTRQGGREAFESLDGKFVYYSKGSSIPGIWRIPATGGEEIRILDEVVQGFWALLDIGIYFVNTKARPLPTIEFFNFATGRTTQSAAIEKDLDLVIPALAISPDGRKILYVQVDHRESDIMLMENFR